MYRLLIEGRNTCGSRLQSSSDTFTQQLLIKRAISALSHFSKTSASALGQEEGVPGSILSGENGFRLASFSDREITVLCVLPLFLFLKH